MEVLSYTKARQKFADVMKKVNADHSPIHVTQKAGEDVVVMSKADYDAIEETMYLMSSATNAMRLSESIAELKNGGGTEKSLVDV